MSTVEFKCPHCNKTNRLLGAKISHNPQCGLCGNPLTNAAIEVTGDQLHALIAKADIPVLVDFWAPWCAPCRAFAPTFSAAAVTYAGRVLMVKLNTEAHQQAAAQYQIRSIPTLMLFKNGKLQQQQAGALSASALTTFIGSVV